MDILTISQLSRNVTLFSYWPWYVGSPRARYQPTPAIDRTTFRPFKGMQSICMFDCETDSIYRLSRCLCKALVFGEYHPNTEYELYPITSPDV